MYGIDKVIDEIRNRCGSKFDVDWIQNMISWMKHPVPDEGVAVVEISAEPVEEPKKGEAEAPELPTSDAPEEKSEETTEEKPEDEECNEECQEDKAESMEAINDTKGEDITPAEQDKMDEILKAIKTFFPEENTEDVLVRIVSKLIDR